MDAQSFGLVAGWGALHLVGLAAAWVSRWSIGRRVERANQLLLGSAFLAIASLAVLHAANGYQLSLLSATTLAMMVVAAVFDSHPDPENKVLTEVLAAYEPSAAAPANAV